MLKEAKVKSDLILVPSRNWQTLVPIFPNVSQFSRVITRLDLKNGVVFADPADFGAPFGELPWYEQGIIALPVREKSLLEIPLDTFQDNLTTTEVISELRSGWLVESHIKVAVEGSPAVEARKRFQQVAPEELEEHLADVLAGELPEAQVTDISHSDFRDTSQPFALTALVEYELVDEAGPGRILLNPWFADRHVSPVFKATRRYSTVRFPYPENRSSTSTWRLPPGVRVEELPSEIHLANELGEFSHSCTQEDNVVTCTRKFNLKKIEFQEMGAYQKAKEFFADIARYDQEVMVLYEE